jgi:hypothetical protein
VPVRAVHSRMRPQQLQLECELSRLGVFFQRKRTQRSGRERRNRGEFRELVHTYILEELSQELEVL